MLAPHNSAFSFVNLFFLLHPLLTYSVLHNHLATIESCQSFRFTIPTLPYTIFDLTIVLHPGHPGSACLSRPGHDLLVINGQSGERLKVYNGLLVGGPSFLHCVYWSAAGLAFFTPYAAFCCRDSFQKWIRYRYLDIVICRS